MWPVLTTPALLTTPSGRPHIRTIWEQGRPTTSDFGPSFPTLSSRMPSRHTRGLRALRGSRLRPAAADRAPRGAAAGVHPRPRPRPDRPRDELLLEAGAPAAERRRHRRCGACQRRRPQGPGEAAGASGGKVKRARVCRTAQPKDISGLLRQSTFERFFGIPGGARATAAASFGAQACGHAGWV